MSGHDIVQVVFAGLAGASAHYWLLTIHPKNRGKEDFKWWVRTIVPQAVAIAMAAKLFHWF